MVSPIPQGPNPNKGKSGQKGHSPGILRNRQVKKLESNDEIDDFFSQIMEGGSTNLTNDASHAFNTNPLTGNHSQKKEIKKNTKKNHVFKKNKVKDALSKKVSDGVNRRNVLQINKTNFAAEDNKKERVSEDSGVFINLLGDKEIDPNDIDRVMNNEKAGVGVVGFVDEENKIITISDKGKENLAKQGIDVDNLPDKVPDDASPALRNFMEAFKGYSIRVDNEAFNAALSSMLEELNPSDDSTDQTVEKQLQELAHALTRHEERMLAKEKEIEKKGDKEDQGKGRVNDRGTFNLKMKLEASFQRERDKIKHHEEQIYIEVIKILDFITKELRKGEIKDWNKINMSLKSELQCEEFLLHEIDDKLIDQMLGLLGRAAIRDPLFTQLTILVFKVSGSCLLAGLPSAGSFSAEKAEGDKVKKVAKFSEKDVKVLQGIDPALYPEIRPLFDLSAGIMRSFDNAIPFLAKSQSQSNIRKEEVEANTEVFPLRAERMAEAGELLQQAEPPPVENQDITAAGVDKFTFLKKPVSDGPKMREEANNAFLPDKLNAQKIEELSRANKLSSTEKITQVAASTGSMKQFNPIQSKKWRNRKVVNVRG